MASSVSGQDESNTFLWLATRAGKMELSCPFGTTHRVFFCGFMDLGCVSVHKHAEKNSANIQPSWPHTWSVIHTSSCHNAMYIGYHSNSTTCWNTLKYSQVITWNEIRVSTLSLSSCDKHVTIQLSAKLKKYVEAFQGFEPPQPNQTDERHKNCCQPPATYQLWNTFEW